MTQEDKELLLKDLSARLPYGVIVNVNGNNEKVDEINPFEGIITCGFQSFDVNECKPYLRSIDSLNEEEIDKLFDILHIDKDGEDGDWIKINDSLGMLFFFTSGMFVEDVAEVYDYLNSIHINYSLPKHLFVAVTEDNNPYET